MSAVTSSELYVCRPDELGLQGDGEKRKKTGRDHEGGDAEKNVSTPRPTDTETYTQEVTRDLVTSKPPSTLLRGQHKEQKPLLH